MHGAWCMVHGKREEKDEFSSCLTSSRMRNFSGLTQ